MERENASWIHRGSNTRVIHWPVDLIDAKHKHHSRKELRNRIGAGKDDKVLVSLGRLHKIKRPIETIRSFCNATMNNKNVHLIMVGMEHGVTIEECKAVAQSLGRKETVHVVGPLFGKDKNDILLGADGYISLSLKENFGHTAAESLSAGIPVILSPGNNLSSELKEWNCGWFMKSDDLSEVELSIRDWIDVPSRDLEEMGLRGRKFIEETCSFDVFRNSLIKLRDDAVRMREY
jgi:glycosyltransferase involved in cell wall biosynthesis